LFVSNYSALPSRLSSGFVQEETFIPLIFFVVMTLVILETTKVVTTIIFVS